MTLMRNTGNTVSLATRPKTKVAFLENRHFSRSELFEIFSNCSDWLGKSRPSKMPNSFIKMQIDVEYTSQVLLKMAYSLITFQKVPAQHPPRVLGQIDSKHSELTTDRRNILSMHKFIV